MIEFKKNNKVCVSHSKMGWISVLLNMIPSDQRRDWMLRKSIQSLFDTNSNIKGRADLVPVNYIALDQGCSGLCTGYALKNAILCQTKGAVRISATGAWWNGALRDNWEDTDPRCFSGGSSLNSVLTQAMIRKEKSSKKDGLCLDCVWPDLIEPSHCGFTREHSELLAFGEQYGIEAFYNIGVGESNFADWCKALDAGYPIYCAFNVDDGYLYNDGDTLHRYNESRIYGGHAICISSYFIDGEGLSFGILGSWGAGHGKNGIVWVSSNYASFIDEAYIIKLAQTEQLKELIRI